MRYFCIQNDTISIIELIDYLLLVGWLDGWKCSHAIRRPKPATQIDGMYRLISFNVSRFGLIFS